MSDHFGTLCIKGLRIFGIKRGLSHNLGKTLKDRHFMGHRGTSLKLISIYQFSKLSSNSLSKNMSKNTVSGPKQERLFFRRLSKKCSFKTFPKI